MTSKHQPHNRHTLANGSLVDLAANKGVAAGVEHARLVEPEVNVLPKGAPRDRPGIPTWVACARALSVVCCVLSGGDGLQEGSRVTQVETRGAQGRRWSITWCTHLAATTCSIKRTRTGGATARQPTPRLPMMYVSWPAPMASRAMSTPEAPQPTTTTDPSTKSPGLR